MSLSISSTPFETCFGQWARRWTDRLHSEEQDIQLLLIRGMRPPDIRPPPDEQNHDGPWDALEETGGGLWVQRRSALLRKYLWSWDQLHSGSQHGTSGQLWRQQFLILQQVNRHNRAPNHNAVWGNLSKMKRTFKFLRYFFQEKTFDPGWAWWLSVSLTTGYQSRHCSWPASLRLQHHLHDLHSWRRWQHCVHERRSSRMDGR